MGQNEGIGAWVSEEIIIAITFNFQLTAKNEKRK